MTADAAVLPGERHNCGDEIFSSFKLLNNLICPGGDGFLVQRSRITIDLNGHRLDGDGSGNGVTIAGNPKPNTKVVLKNGVISNFQNDVNIGQSTKVQIADLIISRGEHGIRVESTSVDRLKITRNTITRTTGDAITLTFPTRTRITNNLVVANAGGITVEQTKGTVISGNRSSGNDQRGITVKSGSRNAVLNNTIEANALSGMDVRSTASATRVSGNTVKGNDGGGIVVADGPATKLSKNVVIGNGAVGISVSASDGVALSRNTVAGNLGDGIYLASNALGASATSNQVNENGGIGIRAIFGAKPKLNGNTANFNGFANGLQDDAEFGILSPDGTAKVRKNSANGNDVVDPALQCAPTTLCTAPVAAVDTPPTLATCGTALVTSFTSFTLHNSLSCPSGSGLVLDAPDITLDLGPHRVRADSGFPDAAIKVPTGRPGVTVRNGIVAGGALGVLVFDSTDAALEDLLVSRNGFGLDMEHATRLHLARNAVLRSSGLGIATHNTDDALIEDNLSAGNLTGNTVVGGITDAHYNRNTLVGNEFGYIFANFPSGFPDRNTFEENRIDANQLEGVRLSNASENTFEANRVRGNGSDLGTGDGFRFTGNRIDSAPGGAVNNTLTNNTITGNVGDGIDIAEESRQNHILGNHVSGNGHDGIHAYALATENEIRANAAHENGVNGIAVENPDPPASVVADNTANYNGFLDDAVGDGTGLGLITPSVAGVSGNSAAFNDDPNDCQPIAIC